MKQNVKCVSFISAADKEQKKWWQNHKILSVSEEHFNFFPTLALLQH